MAMAAFLGAEYNRQLLNIRVGAEYTQGLRFEEWATS